MHGCVYFEPICKLAITISLLLVNGINDLQNIVC